MSEKAEGQGTPPADENNKNVKAEFDRKIQNLEQTNKQILAALQALSTPPKQTKKEEPKKEEKALKDLWYEDEEAAARLIEDRAYRRFEKKLDTIQETQTKTTTVMKDLYKSYPELSDSDHPLTTKAIEIFEKFTPEEKNNPIAYKLAVKEAAEELDFKPKSKRKPTDDDDSFTTSGGGQGQRQQSSKSKKLDAKTLDFAEKMGLDVKDEKVVERIKSRVRSSWNRYE
jgi:hypothetical protein